MLARGWDGRTQPGSGLRSVLCWSCVTQGSLASRHKWCLLPMCCFFRFCEHFLRYFMFSPRKQSLQPKGSASRKRDHCLWSSAFTWGEKKTVCPWWCLVTTLQSANPNASCKMRGTVEVLSFLPLWGVPRTWQGPCRVETNLFAKSILRVHPLHSNLGKFFLAPKSLIHCDPNACVCENSSDFHVYSLMKWGGGKLKSCGNEDHAALLECCAWISGLFS